MMQIFILLSFKRIRNTAKNNFSGFTFFSVLLLTTEVVNSVPINFWMEKLVRFVLLEGG